MRPQFRLPVGERGEAVMHRLREQLDDPAAGFFGQVRGRHAFVRLPEENRSLLSPHLELELRNEEDGAFLHGRFSPRPNVWTGFMAVFFFLAMIGLSGLVYGLSQMVVGGPVWAVWAAPLSLALIGFIYGAAFIGQGLSNDEMYQLRFFVERTVCEVCPDAPRPTPGLARIRNQK
jgi:hypothetical protein